MTWITLWEFTGFPAHTSRSANGCLLAEYSRESMSVSARMIPGEHLLLPTMTTGPLEGVRVIDLASVVMGPFAAQLLGDMGADVIKVEPPQGDLTRITHPQRHPGM